MKLAMTLAAGVLLVPSTVRSQTPELHLQVDTTVVTVGDRIRLEVAVDHPPGFRVSWTDSLHLGPFEIMEARSSPPRPHGEAERSSMALTLTAFELGDLEIPSFDVEVMSPDGGSVVLATNPVGIRVLSVGLDEGGDIRPLKGPLGIPINLLRVLLGGLAALLLATLAYYLYRRTRRFGPGAPMGRPVPPPRPPHEVALEALDLLERSPLLERGEVKEFHIQAADILRTYVEGRFQVPALEMTTTDLVRGMEGIGVEASMAEEYRRFFHPCDMVKFAKQRPGTEESLAILALGRKLVQETIPAQPIADTAHQRVSS